MPAKDDSLFSGRQRNHANPQVADTKDYWWIILYYQFLDHLLNELSVESMFDIHSKPLSNRRRCSVTLLWQNKVKSQKCASPLIRHFETENVISVYNTLYDEAVDLAVQFGVVSS
jgi:hypothetical protein